MPESRLAGLTPFSLAKKPGQTRFFVGSATVSTNNKGVRPGFLNPSPTPLLDAAEWIK
jgi:hypothetical protein